MTLFLHRHDLQDIYLISTKKAVQDFSLQSAKELYFQQDIALDAPELIPHTRSYLQRLLKRSKKAAYYEPQQTRTITKPFNAKKVKFMNHRQTTSPQSFTELAKSLKKK